MASKYLPILLETCMTGLNRLLRPEEEKKTLFGNKAWLDVTLELLFVLINHPVTPPQIPLHSTGCPEPQFENHCRHVIRIISHFNPPSKIKVKSIYPPNPPNQQTADGAAPSMWLHFQSRLNIQSHVPSTSTRAIWTCLQMSPMTYKMRYGQPPLSTYGGSLRSLSKLTHRS